MTFFSIWCCHGEVLVKAQKIKVNWWGDLILTNEQRVVAIFRRKTWHCVTEGRA